MRSVLCKLLFRTNADQLIHFVDANRRMRTFWMQHLWVFFKKKSCLTNLRIWCRHAAINNTNKSAKLKEINQLISRKKKEKKCFTHQKESINNPTRPLVIIHLHLNPLLAGILSLNFTSLLLFSFWASFNPQHGKSTTPSLAQERCWGEGGYLTLPAATQAPPRSAAIRPEVYLVLEHFQPTLFSRRLTASDAPHAQPGNN